MAEIVVSPDGNTVSVPDDLTEDEAAVRILRGQYRHETGGYFHMPGPCIDDDAIINQMRRIALANWASLPGLPPPLRALADKAPTAPGLVEVAFKVLDEKKYRPIMLTDYGRAFLTCQAILGYVMTEPETFVKAFDGQRDMLLENAARFATALFPALTSFPNEHHGDGGSAPYWLSQFPQLASAPPEDRDRHLDKPFFSPVDQVFVVFCGATQRSPYDGDATMDFEFKRRLRAFLDRGANFSGVKAKHRQEVEMAFRMGLGIVPVQASITRVGRQTLPTFLQSSVHWGW